MSQLAAGRIRGLQDLRNGVIGVSDLGSQAHWFINYLALRHGVPPGALKVVAVGTQPNAVAALEKGSIDVWPGFEPGVTRVLRRHPETNIWRTRGPPARSPV